MEELSGLSNVPDAMAMRNSRRFGFLLVILPQTEICLSLCEKDGRR
jgi:hypothetical protein